MTSAATLVRLKTELSRGLTVDEAAGGTDTLWQLTWGHAGGSLGETSALLLMLGPKRPVGAFAHTVGEFGVVLMIGGNIPGETRVLSVAIYDHVETL